LLAAAPWLGTLTLGSGSLAIGIAACAIDSVDLRWCAEAGVAVALAAVLLGVAASLRARGRSERIPGLGAVLVGSGALLWGLARVLHRI
jgi:hypothetical protein